MCWQHNEPLFGCKLGNASSFWLPDLIWPFYCPASCTKTLPPTNLISSPYTHAHNYRELNMKNVITLREHEPGAEGGEGAMINGSDPRAPPEQIQFITVLYDVWVWMEYTQTRRTTKDLTRNIICLPRENQTRMCEDTYRKKEFIMNWDIERRAKNRFAKSTHSLLKALQSSNK